MSISDSDYQGRFTIPTPKGVYQAAGDTNINTDYAYRAENIRTERGLLASSYGTSRAFPSLGAPIETLARFYRRTRPDDADVYVAAAGGAIYTYTMGTEGWVKRSEGYKSDVWSFVTYEAVEGGATVDILILSNEKDGMIAVYGSDLRVERKTLTLGENYENVKFAKLGRHAERIWGVGADGYPDSIFYSRPYDPFTWTDVPETPEIGGGVINQPTWDGDKFISLEPFGGYLLAVKQRTIFEIRGTDPGSFTITEAYGTDGPVEEKSIQTDRTSMFYLTQSGIGLYDGSTLRMLSRDALYETMRMRMDGMDGTARSCVGAVREGKRRRRAERKQHGDRVRHGARDVYDSQGHARQGLFRRRREGVFHAGRRAVRGALLRRPGQRELSGRADGKPVGNAVARSGQGLHEAGLCAAPDGGRGRGRRAAGGDDPHRKAGKDARRAAQKAADGLPGEDSGERRADEAETAQPRQGGGMADLWRGAGGIFAG